MKGQRECFCKGQLRIDGFDRILWNATKLLPSVDVTGELDFGSFVQIVDENMSVKLFGEWGEMEIFGVPLSVGNLRGEGNYVEHGDGRLMGAGIFYQVLGATLQHRRAHQVDRFLGRIALLGP